MYSRLIHILILIIFLMVTGCQKLVNDPGGEKPIFESDSGLVHWGGDYEDKGLAVVQTADGGYAVVGSEYSLENQLDLMKPKLNPQEEKQLRKPGYRQSIAEAIYRGIRNFKDKSERVLQAEG